MGFDRKKIKQIRQLMILAATLILALLYRKEVFDAIAMLFRIMKPFLYGGVIAFVLNIPLCQIENRLLSHWRGKTADKMKRLVAIVLSIFLVVALITVVIETVTPQVAKTVVELGNKIPVFTDNVMKDLEQLSVNYPQIQGYVDELENIQVDWNSLIQKLWEFMQNGMSSVVFSTVSVAGNIISGIVNAVIGFIFALYILGQKEILGNQGKRILKAYFPPKANDYILKVLSLGYRNFSNFISGQCLEAVILGCMFIVSMTILRMPYAILVGVLIAFTALIPIVGAFIGCVVGAFLILVDNPMKAIAFVVLFLILQQIEGNLIYPRVVGNKVGLPSIWVLMAVSVGGSLFGIAGMLFFIPLVSTIYMLLRDSVNARNSRNNNNRKKYSYRSSKYRRNKENRQDKRER